MKDILLHGLSNEDKLRIKNNYKQFDEILSRYRIALKADYIRTEEESLEYCDAISNYAMKIAYLNGYKAALLKSLKLHSVALEELIPDQNE